MSEEESKLVEEVVDTTGTTETKEQFNPLAFSEDVYGELDKTTEALEGAKEGVEGTESTEENEEDGWGWDSKKEEEQEVKKEEEEYNWEEEEEAKVVEATEKSTEGLSWSDVGSELGLEVNSKEEFLKTINAYAESMQQEAAPVNNQITELRNYLSFSDRDLVAEELKADGIEASDIEDSLDKLEDSGMMKMKAKSIRRVIGNSIDQQTSQAKNEKEQNQRNQQKQATEAKQDLKKEIKNMNEFMGGKVTKKQKEEVYRYATGSMMKDIYADHANVADVAMFMLYRTQIEKILRSQGLEDGKASIMNSIVSPNLNTGKSKSNFKVKSGKFDPQAFMGE
tara:strand:+ start:1016 stop:2029 length:1014 start_codon:yes stop_codon:yes gene_type:complete